MYLDDPDLPLKTWTLMHSVMLFIGARFLLLINVIRCRQIPTNQGNIHDLTCLIWVTWGRWMIYNIFLNISKIGGRHSQKAAFVSLLKSWLPTLQPQRTPIEHWRESCTARLAVHYYPIFLIERRNIWPINLRGWIDELRSSSKMALN